MSDRALDTPELTSLSADDAAALWLVRRDRGDAVEADPRFAAWLAGSAANRDAWAHAQSVWDDFDHVGGDPLLGALRRDALNARRPSRALLPLALAAACAVAIIVPLGVVGLKQITPDGGAAGPLIAKTARADFATTTGARASYTLPDGTQVMLDSHSALAIDFAHGRRAARLLYGQAWFSVAHDPAHPFVTEAGDRAITDLGTEFDLRLDGATVTVTLAKGSVSIAPAKGGGPGIHLAPGQRLEAVPGRDDVVRPADLDQTLAWQSGYLEFRDEPLGGAIAEMNRYGGPPVFLRDPTLADLRVSGRFRTGDPVRFAHALEEIYPLRTTPRDDGGLDVSKR
jgi:transmembrane sensor